MPTKSPFPRLAPEARGVSSAAIRAFVDAVEAQKLGLHSFMLLRGGVVLAEAWWRPFAVDIPHIMYSLTKSFTSTAAGLAISEGRFSLDDPVLSFFPRAAPKNASENLAALRVRHLLSMAVGHDADPTGEIMQSTADFPAAFFAIPIPHPPGTHFVYNSAASHMVSAIVQKVTGQKLIAYLMPRLFRPLGIRRPMWELDRAGRNMGGWGLFLRTEEIARFGQMLLQRGQWQGQQVVPAEWIAEATRKQVSNGDDQNSDWAQGYGFQFWMSRYGYRGDGAYGQFCVVLPDQEAVFVATASAPDMQAILNAAWSTLLPGMKDAPLPEDRTKQAALRERLASLELPRPAGAPSSPREAEFLGRTYLLGPNERRWESVTVRREGDAFILALGTPNSAREFRFSATDWLPGEVQLEMPFPFAYAGAGAWQSDDTLDLAARYLVPGSLRAFTLRFHDNAVELATSHTGLLAPPDEFTVTGRAAPAG